LVSIDDDTRSSSAEFAFLRLLFFRFKEPAKEWIGEKRILQLSCVPPSDGEYAAVKLNHVERFEISAEMPPT
jgi:hypothetical protein